MMKLRFFYVGLLSVLVYSCQVEQGCEEYPLDQEQPGDASVYDSVYAKKLGADEYGMHAYVIAFLREGPNRDRSEEEAKRLQAAHMANIMKMADAGDLVVAGPFMDDGELRGIYIFNVATVEEARALTESDPAIQAGSLVMELHPWYSSAALIEVNSVHKRIAKTQF